MSRAVPSALSDRLRRDLDAASACRQALRFEEAWELLEEAHVLSQPWAGLHLRVHGAMLRLAVTTRDRREIAGQTFRLIVAGPGSLLGRYPAGNTGRADVPATLPMPIPDELQRLLDPVDG